MIVLVYISLFSFSGLSEPEAREQALVTLLYSLPPVNFKTAIFLFKHLRRYSVYTDTVRYLYKPTLCMWLDCAVAPCTNVIAPSLFSNT